jgi:gluconolactonase
MAMDASSNLLVAHASLGSVFVLSPQGEPIARIRSCRGATTTNLTFGPDGRTVFVTESETGAVLAAEWTPEKQGPHTIY